MAVLVFVARQPNMQYVVNCSVQYLFFSIACIPGECAEGRRESVRRLASSRCYATPLSSRLAPVIVCN